MVARNLSVYEIFQKGLQTGQENLRLGHTFILIELSRAFRHIVRLCRVVSHGINQNLKIKFYNCSEAFNVLIPVNGLVWLLYLEIYWKLLSNDTTSIFCKSSLLWIKLNTIPEWNQIYKKNFLFLKSISFNCIIECIYEYVCRYMCVSENESQITVRRKMSRD